MKMTTRKRWLNAALMSGACTVVSPLYAAQTLEDLQKTVEAQQKELEQLKEKLDATADMLEQGNPTGERREGSLGASHSPFAHGSTGRTILGGYGELHYNNLQNQKTGGGTDKKELDLHRIILFLGHEFDQNIRFFSELEIEHGQAGEGKSGGEVAIEQAYLEFDLHDELQSRAGLLLVPVGFINETHEPPVFYGVERNPVESRILPSTWREAGVGLSGRFAQGWSYDLLAHSGLKTAAGTNYAVRDGRQSGRNAVANDLAYTGRLKWTGMAGLELGATVQWQTDATQSNDSTAGSASLYEMHAAWNQGPFAARALYAAWNLDGSGPASVGADQQQGWYVEPSYKINPKVGVFARYNAWDNQAGDSADSDYQQVDVGVNYWPHPDVVVKADYQDQSAPNGKDEFDGFNLGVGYQF